MPIDRRSVLGGTALLLTGPAALADGITSNSNMTPAVVTPTGISLSQTSVSFVGTVNANAFVATVIVTATGGTYSGPVTLGGSDAAKFALSNGGTYPCNLTVGAANLPAGNYSVSVTAGPVTLPPPPITVVLTPPAFVPQADGVSADIYMDFVNGNYWGAAPGPSTSPPAWTFSRSGQAWGDNQAGVWTSFATGVPVITNKGLIVSVQATNLALQSRDMTQAAWVKTSMTAARSQVGIDNANNSANLLTATAANATVLQAITAASATYITSFFLKRSAGTGVVNITTDGGTTWTAQTLTPAFQRFFVTKAALTNPSIGIQIVTSGDAVIADFAQCEASSTTIAVPTTPIFTTTAALARGIDFVSIPGLTIGTGVTLFAAATPIGGQVGNAFVLSITDGSTSNRLILERSTTNARGAVVVAATTTNMVIATAWPDVPGKIAAACAAGAQATVFNGGTASTAAVGFPTGLNTINFGQPGTGAVGLWYVTSIAAWINHASTNAALQALTVVGTSTAINLSTTSVSFPNAADAGSFVAHVTVTASGGGTYAGVLTLGGTDGSKFALSNGGVYPCDLMVGPVNIPANTTPGYAIQLTANP